MILYFSTGGRNIHFYYRFFFFHSSSFFPFFFFMFHNDSIIKYERKSPLRPDCLFSKFKSLALHLQPPMKHLLVNNSTPFVL